MKTPAKLYTLPRLAKALRRRGWDISVNVLANLASAKELRVDVFRDILLCDVATAEQCLCGCRLRPSRN